MKRITPLNQAHVREMHRWQYPGELAMYSFKTEDFEKNAAFFLDPSNGYFGIFSETGELEGFCTFGEDARVTGGDYSEKALDVGIGLRPDLVGQGFGYDYAQYVFRKARSLAPGSRLRVTIAEFNRPSIRVCEKSGFAITQRFARETDGLGFVVLTAA